MAQRTVIHFYSDLSGDELEPTDATVRFAVDGTSYEVDLTADEQATFRELLAPYIDVARKSGRTNGRRRSTPAPAATPEASPREIREWAVANGYEVPARGRIPAQVREAYATAH